jgi:uncharacterized protein (TIGR00266 family)
MKYEILKRPDFGMAKITFETAGESITVESGAMVARDTDVSMKTAMTGGLFSAAKRKLLGGESLFQNTFSGSKAGETLYLAPAMDGDLEVVDLREGDALAIQSSGYVANGPDVKLDTKWGGARGFFSGHGLFFMQATGTGPVFVSSYGALHKIKMDGSRDYIVDNSHVVAFRGDLTYEITKLGGLKSLFLSGEGLVCKFKGHGEIWIQTRNPSSFAAWVNGFRRVQSSSN